MHLGTVQLRTQLVPVQPGNGSHIRPLDALRPQTPNLLLLGVRFLRHWEPGLAPALVQVSGQASGEDQGTVFQNA